MSEIVAGRRAVFELLISEKREFERLIVAYGTKGDGIQKLISLAKSKGIAAEFAHRSNLDKLSNGLNHQGIIAIVSDQEYVSLEDIISLSKSRTDPIVLILDQIQYSQNLGAILRVAEAVGACGTIIPKRRAAGLTSAVMRASAGAAAHVSIAKVSNISYAIEELKTSRFWIIGTEPAAQTLYYQADLQGPLGVVIGNEGSGIRPLVKEKCDLLVKIPMFGSIKSLNASISAGIILYEVIRQREEKAKGEGRSKKIV